MSVYCIKLFLTVCYTQPIFVSLRIFFNSNRLTFLESFLSARRAKMSPTKYIPNMAHTVERTTKFLVSPSRLNSGKTLLKSMGLGATKILPPNAERCVHKQCIFPFTSFSPTFKKEESSLNKV